MAKVVEEVVKIGGYEYPGYVQTSQDDVSFLRQVLLVWSQISKSEVDQILPEGYGGGDAVYRTDGFLVTDTMSNKINLIKIGEGQWVVVGMNYEELVEFAGGCEGNLE